MYRPTQPRGDGRQDGAIELAHLIVDSTTEDDSSASVTLKINDKERSGKAAGDGPVDASYRAVHGALGKKYEGVALEEYLVQAMTGGSDDTGKVHVEISKDEVRYYGFGSDTDIVIASVKAYIDALNKL